MITKVVDFEGEIEGGAQCLSVHMNSRNLEEMIEECEYIKVYLNKASTREKIKGMNGTNWKYKIGFYEAKNGIVTVGAI